MPYKTEIGGYYKAHIDNYELGHFSTTVFLNDGYGGGELELLVDDKVQQYKLPAGHAVTYKTGTPHQVKPVTDGVRYVGVTWTSTLLPNDQHRDVYTDLWTALGKIESQDRDGNLLNYREDPHALVENAMHKILRFYGQLGN